MTIRALWTARTRSRTPWVAASLAAALSLGLVAAPASGAATSGAATSGAATSGPAPSAGAPASSQAVVLLPRPAPHAEPGVSLTLSTTWVFPQDYDRPAGPVKVRVSASSGPVRVEVKRGTAVVWSKQGSGATLSTSIPLTALRKAGTYQVHATAGPETTKASLRVSRGWAPLMDSVAHWPRCKTLTWAYDASDAPQGGDKQLVADLTKVLARYSELTGLTFSRVTGPLADIVVAWEEGTGADATGGAGEYDGVLVTGVLNLFTSSEWAKTPGMGVKGRGALLYHELMHVLGYGHVTDDQQLMYPIHTLGVSPLEPQSGDIAGLRELYAPKTCR